MSPSLKNREEMEHTMLHTSHVAQYSSKFPCLLPPVPPHRRKDSCPSMPQKLTPAEVRSKVVEEILNTERDYVQHLKDIIEVRNGLTIVAIKQDDQDN